MSLGPAAPLAPRVSLAMRVLEVSQERRVLVGRPDPKGLQAQREVAVLKVLLGLPGAEATRERPVLPVLNMAVCSGQAVHLDGATTGSVGSS